MAYGGKKADLSEIGKVRRFMIMTSSARFAGRFGLLTAR